jgi:hypothetical protein
MRNERVWDTAARGVGQRGLVVCLRPEANRERLPALVVEERVGSMVIVVLSGVQVSSHYPFFGGV